MIYMHSRHLSVLQQPIAISGMAGMRFILFTRQSVPSVRMRTMRILARLSTVVVCCFMI